MKKLMLPESNPLNCASGACKCLWQGNTHAFTLAIYCEPREYSGHAATTMCAYMSSCGVIVRDSVPVEPTDTLKDTIRKASHQLFPKLVNFAYAESKTDGIIWQ